MIDSENTGTLTASVGSFASGSQLSLATATKFTGLTVNTTGTFVGDLVASDVTSLTINSDYAFTGEGSTDIDAVKTLTITGSGAVDLSADVVAAATSIDASSNTGGVSVHYHGNVGTFTGGSGNDVVESQTEAISKAVSLGGGDDTFILEAHSSGTTVTAALDGGSGTDTISMTGAAAVALDGNTVFGDDLTNFEILKLGALANSANVSAKNLGLNSQVITTGTASNGTATGSGLAANSTVTLDAGAGSGSLVLALDTATGTSDVINLKTDINGNLALGDLEIVNVETVNLSAVDKFVDVTGGTDAFGVAIADGIDDTNSVQSVTLDIDEATTLNITGNADLTVDLEDGNGSGLHVSTTLVDASAFTGKFTLIADGAKTAGTTVKGGSGVNTLTADGSNDVLIGGASNDVLTATVLTTLTGGAGADTFKFGTAVSSSTYSKF